MSELPIIQSSEIIIHSIQVYRFTKYTEIFIRAARNGEVLTPRGMRYSSGMIKGYEDFLMHFRNYESFIGYKVQLKDISWLFTEGFYNHLVNSGLAMNTCASYSSRFKSMIRRLHKMELMRYNGMGMKGPREITTQIYLTLEDLTILYMASFHLTKGQKRAILIFIMQCFIGLRVSDMLRFAENPNKFRKIIDGVRYIEIHTDKTGEVVVIPEHAMVSRILAEYNYDFGVRFSQQYYNKTSKTVAMDCGLTETVFHYRTEGGEVVERELEKWQLISSHTARRTFATLAYLAHVPVLAIMKITGHKTETAFRMYIRCSSLESAKAISGHEFFRIDLIELKRLSA